MTAPFGPQLIGQTEKSLSALLLRVLDGRLTEPQWVALRLAQVLDGELEDDAALAVAVADRARFADAPALIDALVAAGLVAAGRPTPRGRELVDAVQNEIAATTAPIWQGLDVADVAAAGRVLDEVLRRARAVLAGG
ncbi:MarR family transcriptional regulator [Nocardioides sp. LHD-245]|uniref:MarR family transcriptional regulator n=1 Tax=Nocardioides sp. LHD-245 TaxID=3051387 RepID=UPI0027E080C1|nr:MarR family transcriptional regulator [Nocardioides sp. LHD-245]